MSTITGIESRSTQSWIFAALGVIPPVSRASQSSIRRAPPFSAARAEVTESTQASIKTLTERLLRSFPPHPLTPSPHTWRGGTYGELPCSRPRQGRGRTPFGTRPRTPAASRRAQARSNSPAPTPPPGGRGTSRRCSAAPPDVDEPARHRAPRLGDDRLVAVAVADEGPRSRLEVLPDRLGKGGVGPQLGPVAWGGIARACGVVLIVVPRVDHTQLYLEPGQRRIKARAKVVGDDLGGRVAWERGIDEFVVTIPLLDHGDPLINYRAQR